MSESLKPARAKGILWFIFSGTAMLSAFIVPLHIWALQNGFAANLNEIYFSGYFFVLFFAALYHGLYRVKTIVVDLGFAKFEKILGTILIFIFAAAMIFVLMDYVFFPH